MPKADFLFEASWEVCNKVGGIYTVVSSKAAPMMKHYGEHYYLIGPYFYEKAKNDFLEGACPDEYKDISYALKEQGILLHFGTWLINARPKTILIDFTGYNHQTNDVKRQLWEKFAVDSWGTSYYDFDEPVIWSWCVGILLEEIHRSHPDRDIVAQFHEWLSGAGLLYLKDRQVKIGTVFTTHATILGRTLTSAGIDIYKELDHIDAEAKAKEYGIQAKHLVEVACADHADAFTTVSEITGIEAEALLHRKPDVLLPNGLNMEQFPTFEELSVRHQAMKRKANRFLMDHFFPYYPLDLDHTLLYFILGRYEFRDKGIDVFIESLARLNAMMKKEGSEKTIVAFFFIPSAVRGIKTSLIESKAALKDIRDEIVDQRVAIENRITAGIIQGEDLNEQLLFNEETRNSLKKKVLRLHRQGLPPICTHDLVDPDHDAITLNLNRVGLNNSEEQKVKVVFYPIYLTGADGLLDLDYYETIQAMHLGVFPSAYEPWGYTPLEAGALGVASVTTDLAGFGRFIRNKEQKEEPGIFILDRYQKTTEEIVEQLTGVLEHFTDLSKEGRVRNKIQAKNLAMLADWNILSVHYIEAHDLAMGKVFS